ncbi:Fmp42p KNAG_0J02090 [Huiozyma naganishii CBS 8797]|uniref:Protein FMP42 n=1 Tax=Huiozyma naganishii (strain ATCC MYA-139 / BCRC 22969 / CBS 8797 / KCTC 17520 / NBRC 10181 / NCYC 3082 / Yp74L-3) TaxID=1071383 RepID=J7RBM5_HUIN7|nr:hypothetical protein KNAG_0J02090 [Kazachstania naganishii CBS 8797]CCK72290.1 hypothetical protein KNAG_0J02090 [Kazachstania naganishii CBS 8797]
MPSDDRLRKLQVICASFWCLLSAGIIFGFAAFKIVLIEEGVYSDLCSDPHVPGEKACVKQDLKLNYMFTVSAGLTNVMALPVGYILDHYGPRISGFIGSIGISMGALFFIFAKRLYPVIDPYLIGYMFLAAGGPFVFISCFQLANSFPAKSGAILAVLTGAFDTSSALFLGYRLFYQKISTSLTLGKFFTLYLTVPAFIFICQCTIMPSSSYKSVAAVARTAVEGLNEEGQFIDGNRDAAILPDDEEERQFLLASNSRGERRISVSGRRVSVLEAYAEGRLEEKSGGLFGILHDQPALTQIKTPWFYLMLIFAALAMLRVNYFIATIRTQEEYLLGDIKAAIRINGIFDILLPLGGVISIPFIGIILDHFQSLTTLALLANLSVVIGLFGLVKHSFLANLIGIVLFVVYRPFYYTVVSDYCSKVFGFQTFGTIYGLLTCLCGIFNLAQSKLDAYTHTTFKMNPGPINAILVTLTIISTASLIQYIRIQLRLRQHGNTN